ncbi:MAG TPA: DUF1003 domain-containing protein [Actinomycetota bacterium]|jgi:uncharacterized membrane protein|nr:DUF1003 domain-containing protein [Actinomycetota bacterium]
MSQAQQGACEACRNIDLADELEDRRLSPTFASRVGHEKTLFRALHRAQTRVADRITAFSGSMTFVYLHVAWFAFWIAINEGLHLLGLPRFDPFPFGLLTMIVSLEAIFLGTFVLISQNRQSQRADIRSQLDFENNVRSEVWAVHIGHALGIDPDHVEKTVRSAIEGYLKEEAERE